MNSQKSALEPPAGGWTLEQAAELLLPGTLAWIRQEPADEQQRQLGLLGDSLLYELSLRGDLWITGEDTSQPGRPRVAVSPADLYFGRAYVALDVLQGTVRYEVPGCARRLEAVRIEAVKRTGKRRAAKKRAPNTLATGPRARFNPHGYPVANADQIRAAMQAVYADAARRKLPAPTLRDVAALVAKRLKKQKLYAKHVAIEPIAAEPEFKGKRGRRGNPNFR